MFLIQDPLQASTGSRTWRCSLSLSVYTLRAMVSATTFITKVDSKFEFVIGISKIEGLEDNTKLLSLYLQENLIEKIEGLHTLTNLRQLNLTDCLIQRIEGLSTLTSLETIQLKRNRIGKFGGIDDVLGLLECPSLTVVDLSDNFIEEDTIIEELWEKMPKIAVIYFQGNPAIKKIKNYRKTIITKIPTLKYLDDRPVFEDDRVAAEAFSRGGFEEERQARDRLRKEKEDAHWRNHEAFKEMVAKAREEKRLADEAKRESSRLAIEEASVQEELVPAEPAEPVQVEEEVARATQPEIEAHEELSEEEEDLPELEQVDIEEEKRLLLTKQQKQQEWLE